MPGAAPEKVSTSVGVCRRRNLLTFPISMHRAAFLRCIRASIAVALLAGAGVFAAVAPAATSARSVAASSVDPLPAGRAEARPNGGANRAPLQQASHFWGVQVTPWAGGWFDKDVLRRVRPAGVNALVLDTTSLPGGAAGVQLFNQVRSFAISQRMTL